MPRPSCARTDPTFVALQASAPAASPGAILHITQFLRPFTLGQVKDLLAEVCAGAPWGRPSPAAVALRGLFPHDSPPHPGAG